MHVIFRSDIFLQAHPRAVNVQVVQALNPKAEIFQLLGDESDYSPVPPEQGNGT